MASKEAVKKEAKVSAKTESKPAASAATETKTEVKSEAKAETKTSIKSVAKKKYIPYVLKMNKKKSDEAYKIQKTLDSKKHVPTFRGRFGKKNIRRKSIDKWDKWRKPHGIDLDKGLQHGFRPKIGYRSDVEVRFLHPSGYKDVLVCNMNDLEKINPKTEAARLAATLGKKKRNMIVEKANQKGIWVLN